MKQFSIAMLALGIMLAAVPVARADTTCLNQTLSGSTVNDNLIVPPGATCVLIGVTVTGNVQVLLNATLIVTPSPNGSTGTTIVGNLQVGTGATLDTSQLAIPMTVGGNVSADQCAAAIMPFVKVSGNVQIQNCTQGASVGPNVQIGGNSDCSENSGPCQFFSSSVNGNVQVNDNNGASVVQGNTIGGNLQCQDNASITGGANAVGGTEQGQCAGF